MPLTYSSRSLSLDAAFRNIFQFSLDIETMETPYGPLEIRAFIILILCSYAFYRLICYYLAAHERSQHARRLGCEPAPSYPHLDPIFGLDTFYTAMRALSRGHVLDEFDSRFKRTAGGVSTFSMVSLGSRELHTIEPENVKTILSLRSKDYHHSAARIAALAFLGRGILNSDDEEWEVSRAMLRPTFHKSQIRDLSTLEEHVGNFLACLPNEGEVVDLQPLFFRLTNDTIFESLLGQSTYSLLGEATDPRNTQMFNAISYTTERIALRIRIGRLATILPDTKLTKARAFIHKYVGDYISRALVPQEPHENDKNDKYILLHEMVKANSNPTRVRSELLHVLGAGRETTAAVLSVLCYTIVRHPEIMQKLRDEIADHIGANLPTYENMRSLKYLKWTINESTYFYIFSAQAANFISLKAMRLYPVLPINARVAVVDTVLPLGGGADGKSPVFVKAGTTVTWSPYSLHRREEDWGADVREFKPERWETQENRV